MDNQGEYDIREMFAELTLEQFLVYLPGRGWSGAPEKRPDRVRFELPDGDDPFVLFLPKSNRSRNCQGMLQRAIYLLSGIEDREPVEIARDLLSTTSDAPMSAEATSVRLRFHNSHSTAVTLHVTNRPAPSFLMPGESAEIVCEASPDVALEIDIREEG